MTSQKSLWSISISLMKIKAVPSCILNYQGQFLWFMNLNIKWQCYASLAVVASVYTYNMTFNIWSLQVIVKVHTKMWLKNVGSSVIFPVIPPLWIFCFKRASIILVPKKNNVTSLNDYWPMARMSVVMKYFEGLAIVHINSHHSKNLDPVQFAYHHNRSMGDAISLALHSTWATWTIRTQMSSIRSLTVTPHSTPSPSPYLLSSFGSWVFPHPYTARSSTFSSTDHNQHWQQSTFP